VCTAVILGHLEHEVLALLEAHVAELGANDTAGHAIEPYAQQSMAIRPELDALVP
jgi:hypothetical protein